MIIKGKFSEQWCAPPLRSSTGRYWNGRNWKGLSGEILGHRLRRKSSHC